MQPIKREIAFFFGAVCGNYFKKSFEKMYDIQKSRLIFVIHYVCK